MLAIMLVVRPAASRKSSFLMPRSFRAVSYTHLDVYKRQLLQCAPMDEPVYQFMNKKRSEGKPYRVYMMASANKFLRIYYCLLYTSRCV